MVTTSKFIEKMNALDQDAVAPEPVGNAEQVANPQPEDNRENEPDIVGGAMETNSEPSGEPMEETEVPEVEKREDTDTPELVDQDDEDSNDEDDEDSEEEDLDEEEGVGADGSKRKDSDDDHETGIV
jgi:hypothetical protein